MESNLRELLSCNVLTNIKLESFNYIWCTYNMCSQFLCNGLHSQIRACDYEGARANINILLGKVFFQESKGCGKV